MSSEPERIPLDTGGNLFVSRYTGPRGAPRVQLDAGSADAPLTLSLDDVVAVSAALLAARQEWRQ